MNFRFVLHLFFMALPFFYSEEIKTDSNQLVLNEETSKHVVQVLRMQKGDQLNLTDGAGNLFTTEIMDDHKKRCEVKILSRVYNSPSSKKIAIAISLIKNASRFEWFLEKATEIGVAEITPLICGRTEKQHFRLDRMKAILISAMLQSQQTWLPVLHAPKKFEEVVNRSVDGQKYIAHCDDDINKKQLSGFQPFLSSIILVGPEGDFTNAEINDAISNGFIPVALGETRLRTETAGLVASVLLCS